VQCSVDPEVHHLKILLQPSGPIMACANFNSTVAAGFGAFDCKAEHQQPWQSGGVDPKVACVSSVPPIPMPPCPDACICGEK
jgi:hypothetical protein